MSNIADSKKYFYSHSARFQDGSSFLGFRSPAAQTFTSYSPSNDINGYLNSVTGKNGWEHRQFLQSEKGGEFLQAAMKKARDDAITKLDFPGYHAETSCQRDNDCNKGQVCYIFNEKKFGTSHGPICSDVVFPEISLGNKYNKGIPIRQHSNFCKKDEDCTGEDEYTGKPKKGMKCNHYTTGNKKEDIGLCQVEYTTGKEKFFLQQPPGLRMSLDEKLESCKHHVDCGKSGINGWTRCEPAGDGKSYCSYPGQTIREHGAVVPMSLPRFK